MNQKDFPSRASKSGNLEIRMPFRASQEPCGVALRLFSPAHHQQEGHICSVLQAPGVVIMTTYESSMDKRSGSSLSPLYHLLSARSQSDLLSLEPVHTGNFVHLYTTTTLVKLLQPWSHYHILRYAFFFFFSYLFFLFFFPARNYILSILCNINMCIFTNL